MGKFIKFKKEFGFWFSVKYFFFTFIMKLNAKFEKSRNKVILKYLNKKYAEQITNITIDNRYDNSNKNIWVFWWSGLDTAPEIVKTCVKKIIKSSPNKKVILLDKNNISKYVEIPQYIYDKLNSGEITITHFSDILRMSLLTQHGGMWIDATIYYTGENIEEYLNKDFFTIKHKENNSNYIPRGRWTGYCLASNKSNLLALNVKYILYKYWQDHNLLIDYFLIDFLIEIVYSNSKQVKDMMDSLELNNPNNEALIEIINTPFNEEIYKNLKLNTNIFKLSWKKEFVKEINKQETFYNYIINQE